MRVRKLARMSVAEVAGRSRQAASRRLERVGLLRARGAVPGDVPAALASFRTRFFEGAAAPHGPAASGGADAHAARIVARAERLLSGRFDLMGYRDLSFGDPIDWRLDPVTGRRAPAMHWSRIDLREPVPGGDVKIVWELSRHQWLVTLGQAYRLTGDPRYARAFAEAIEGWLRDNPPGRGVHWASSLEVAFRLIAWCWSLALFDGAPEMTPSLATRLVAGIAAHAARIERYVSHFSSPNTHLTGEALALFYAGVLLPALPRAAAWRAAGARVLVAEADAQVLPDGVYFERSTWYQRYTADFYLHFVILAARAGIGLPDSVRAGVSRMLDFLLAVRRPDGSMPQIGDADGGRLLALDGAEPNDYSATFSTGAVLLGRADFAWAAGGLSPETLWLLGAPAHEAHARLAPAPPPGLPSRLFREGGYAVMRDGWSVEDQHLVLDVGPSTAPAVSGHDHADLLAVQCAVGGEPFIVDPGTYRYAVEPEWRAHFRDTAAHSTVTIDGAGQSRPLGPFGWAARPRARLLAWASSERFDYADACHQGYERLGRGLVHRRRVLSVRSRCWVVVDDVEGTGEHAVEVRFQFAPLALTVDPALWACARGQRAALLIRAMATVPLKTEVREGTIAPIDGWVSDDYGRRVPAPALVYSTVASLPLRVLTLLWPAAADHDAPPAVEAIVEGSGLVGLRLPDGIEARFTRDGVDVSSERPGSAVWSAASFDPAPPGSGRS